MKIEICDWCFGNGLIEDDEQSPTFNSGCPYINCKKCNGTGRVLTSTYTYQVPFDIDTRLIYDTDTKIVELIRELQKKK